MPRRFAAAALVCALHSLPVPAAEGESPWKVDDPHGPYDTVAFDTDEGTWLHVDVHPDGSRIVFSLLGDLYLLPSTGGRATRITDGPASDVEPRFSPDGTRIAFASDRGGMENLWVCDLDGKNARAVSTEKQSTVSAPAWSPDGDWLLGRKRITDRSSIGAVELWMWHLRGGEGVRVSKAEEQPDAADPVFSHDGRFVYYAGRGSRYVYDRNPNEGIWQIQRFDRTTGQTVPLTALWGGASRPTPSPDGKSLAFVRRWRAETRIELLDLATGAVRTAARDVQRDNQEGFAIHGTFPGFAWTPDGNSLVATAGGKIWKWSVSSGTREAIPFTAHVEQRVSNAIRFPRRVGETGKVRARILRWPVESPDGRRLVFSALGHLYAMDLPSGTPRRLTTGDDLEFAPSFSPDGSTLAYVTWNDEMGGHVFTVPAAGGAAKRITQQPAQYANPSFSPGGERLVFLKGSGATFRGEDLGDELWHEIWTASASGGRETYVASTKNRGANRRMPRPAFSKDGERIYFVENEPPAKPTEVPKTVLVSVKTDGTDKRAHLRWTRAEEAAVSPDGEWVVFSEQHNAWVTALPSVGSQTVDVSLESPALPLAQLTDEGGEWVNWADHGRTVTWIHGPGYRRLALDEALPEPKPAQIEKGSKEPKAKEEKKALPKAQAVEVVLEVPRAAPTGRVHYRNARVVTMKGEDVLERGTIVVDGDRIEAVGPTDRVPVPSGDVRVVDLAGKTIIPGLIDEHAHLHYTALDIFPQRPWKYLANLAYGVTTTHDPSASTHEVFGQAEMVEAGLMIGPRVFSTGFVLYGADDPARAIVKSLDDAKKHLRRLKTLGAFSVKSYMQPGRDQRQWILEAARQEKLLVVPEGGGDLETNVGMILDGHTTVEHALPVVPLYKDVVTLFAESETAYAPTLLVAYGGPSGDKWYHQHYDLWKDEKLLRFVPQGLVDTLGRRRMMLPDEDWHFDEVAGSAAAVERAGGTVCLGGHGQMQGLGPHWEIWGFVRGGMTPLEALRVATVNPAKALGLDADLGSIEAGKLADFVVLDRNPLEKIENTDSVFAVVKNGVEYRPEDLGRKPNP